MKALGFLLANDDINVMAIVGHCRRERAGFRLGLEFERVTLLPQEIASVLEQPRQEEVAPAEPEDNGGGRQRSWFRRILHIA